MLSPEARAAGERQAAGDLALLARLRDEGRIERRDGEFEVRHADVARPFVASVERLRRHGRAQATIRPNAKKSAKRRKRR